jgi:hypothetical protein
MNEDDLSVSNTGDIPDTSDSHQEISKKISKKTSFTGEYQRTKERLEGMQDKNVNQQAYLSFVEVRLLFNKSYYHRLW